MADILRHSAGEIVLPAGSKSMKRGAAKNVTLLASQACMCHLLDAKRCFSVAKVYIYAEGIERELAFQSRRDLAKRRQRFGVRHSVPQTTWPKCHAFGHGLAGEGLYYYFSIVFCSCSLHTHSITMDNNPRNP